MFLIVGLGNPGKKYTNTRHNVGFKAIEALAEKYQLPSFRLDKKARALISQGVMESQKVILAKPQTFMNDSGLAVKSLLAKYQILNTKYLMVAHDDIDLPLGKIRIVQNRGSAGHKGVDSIIKSVGAQNFVRFRVGIQPEAGKPKDTDQFVLKNFSKKEVSVLEQVITKVCDALAMTLTEGVEKTMSEYNK